MSYIGNPPVVQSSRLVYEETAATAKTAFTPPGGYTVGQLEVYINGSQLMSDDFTATDGSTVNLTTACAVGDGFKSIAYGNFLASNAVNKSGDTMTGPLTMGGLLGLGSTGQIKFPAAQNASADANTLDDYEEGTWSPVITGSTSGSAGGYGNQYGRYVKVGSLVTVWGFITFTKGNVLGAVNMSLPFAAAPFTGYGDNGAVAGTWSWAGDMPKLLLTVGNQAMCYMWDALTNTVTDVDLSVSASSNNLVFSLTYRAAS